MQPPASCSEPICKDQQEDTLSLHISLKEMELEDLLGMKLVDFRKAISESALSIYNQNTGKEIMKYERFPLYLTILTKEMQSDSRGVGLEDTIWKEVFQVVSKTSGMEDSNLSFKCMLGILSSILCGSEMVKILPKENNLKSRDMSHLKDLANLIDMICFDRPVYDYFPETSTSLLLDSLHCYISYVMLGKSMFERPKIRKEVELQDKLMEMNNNLMAKQEQVQNYLKDLVEMKINEVNNCIVQNWAQLTVQLLNTKEQSITHPLKEFVEYKINEVVLQQKEKHNVLENSLKDFVESKTNEVIQVLKTLSTEKASTKEVTTSKVIVETKQIESKPQNVVIPNTVVKPSTPTVDWVVPKDCFRQFTDALKKFKSSSFIHKVVSYESYNKNVRSNKIVYVTKNSGRIDPLNFKKQMEDTVGTPTLVVSVYLRNQLEIPFPNVYQQPYTTYMENGEAVIELLQFKPEIIEKELLKINK